MTRASLAPLLSLLLLACGPPIYTCTDPLPRQVPDPSSPRLHQDGQRLVAPDGSEVHLDGVNLGGWLMWEAWIWGRTLQLTHLDRQSESHMLLRLTELYGAQAAATFQGRIDAELVTQADLAAIADLGMVAVRLPLNHTVVEDPARLVVVDRLLDAAEAEGLWVVLDLHAAPGGQANLFTADPDPVLLWDDTDAQDQTVADWRTLAARSADHPAVAGYDLLNEPQPPDDAVYLDLLGRIIAAVREEDPDTLIIVEGTSYARDFRPFTTRLDENMAYEAHLYTALDGAALQRPDGFSELARCHDTPVWLGEYGEDQPDQVGDLRQAIAGANLAGAAFWPWKKVLDGRYPGLEEIQAPADWDPLMEDLTAKTGKAGHLDWTQAQAALDGFLAAAEPQALHLDAEMAAAIEP